MDSLELTMSVIGWWGVASGEGHLRTNRASERHTPMSRIVRVADQYCSNHSVEGRRAYLDY